MCLDDSNQMLNNDLGETLPEVINLFSPSSFLEDHGDRE
jgi:hypothetical protein